MVNKTMSSDGNTVVVASLDREHFMGSNMNNDFGEGLERNMCTYKLEICINDMIYEQTANFSLLLDCFPLTGKQKFLLKENILYLD